VELIPIFAAVVSVIAGAQGATALVICVALWLRFCRYIYDDAVKHDQKPKTAEVIQAASFGMIGRSPKAPALPSSTKSDDKSLAA
jgi:hypothetical protein